MNATEARDATTGTTTEVFFFDSLLHELSVQGSVMHELSVQGSGLHELSVQGSRLHELSVQTTVIFPYALALYLVTCEKTSLEPSSFHV